MKVKVTRLKEKGKRRKVQGSKGLKLLVIRYLLLDKGENEGQRRKAKGWEVRI